jgi:formiminotetrahydrofolate cyclodeaminase
MLENINFKIVSAVILASPDAGAGGGSVYAAAAAIAFGLLRVAANALWRRAAPHARTAGRPVPCLNRVHELQEQRHA